MRAPVCLIPASVFTDPSSSAPLCPSQHAKAGDLKINVCKTKQLTNMRAASKEIKVGASWVLGRAFGRRCCLQGHAPSPCPLLCSLT